jgi:hypothetical protein
LKQAVIAPEKIVLAAIDLVEGFFDFDVERLSSICTKVIH